MIASHKSPLIIGHRGASAVAPENTLAAFARAFRDGADGVELDVRLARDGVPVVIHDATVPHTGLRKQRVARTSSDKLQQIDVGSWFNRAYRRLARLEYTRQTIPTLDDVFRLLANQPSKELIVYAELKAGRARKKNDELAAAVVELVDRHQLRYRVVVISFNLRTVARIKELDSSIRTGALFGPRQRAMKSTRQIVAAAIASRADEILLHHRIATKKIVAAAHGQKLATAVWTVDDQRWLARARSLDISAILTNHPAKMLA
ncbi:MAG TPA: glycerophosphodiester phosphodiesterase family protein [Pyrinomonadaceae bacterium]|nr:glycerophosphodiester phosphodiesterase family protein [Pyrinomonadaceae bacterium]